jgi:hypothetical protein
MYFPTDEELAKYLEACLRIYLKKRIFGNSYLIKITGKIQKLNSIQRLLKKNQIIGVDIIGSVNYYMIFNTCLDHRIKRYSITRMLHYLSQSSQYTTGLNLSDASDILNIKDIKYIFRFAIKALKYPNKVPPRLFGR